MSSLHAMPKAGWLALAMALTAGALVIYKVAFAGYGLETIVPVVAYEVRTVIRLEGHDDAVRVRYFLPRSDARQTVGQEEFSSADLRGAEEIEGDNRRISWSAPSVEGPRTITVSYHASGRAVRYVLPPGRKSPPRMPFLRRSASDYRPRPPSSPKHRRSPTCSTGLRLCPAPRTARCAPSSTSPTRVSRASPSREPPTP